jgi:predicted Ser/Thr protein kinase
MMGERLGRWVLSTEIGRGGMGRVYLAAEDVTGRQGAVKILSPDLAVDAGFLNRFQREIEALSQLSHPNIVQFYDSGHESGQYFYVMEYVSGDSLEEIVDHQKRMGWREVVEIALQICPALKHVHDHGIIHRDIKLSNILVREDGVVKLTDFGIAKVFATTDLTQTGGVVGTAEYLSPEQAMGKPVTKRSDIYSLGVVLYCLLTGRLPFSGTGYLDLMHKHRYAQFDRPGKIVPELPYEIDELVCQLLEKDPGKRPADCLVLGKQIDSIRRKLERKDQGTRVGDTDTIAQTKAVFDPRTPGPITLAERLGRGSSPYDHRGPIGRAFNHPLVVIVLLAACLGTIAYAFWAPSDEFALFNQGAALMESDRLSDKESAWKNYFEPILTRNPNTPWKEVIEKYRRRLVTARAPEEHEAHRFLALAQKKLDAGDVVGAAAVWRSVIDAFDGLEAETDAVEQARTKLAAIASPKVQVDRLRQVRPILDRATSLKAAGKRDDAERIWAALETLYRDDPNGGAVMEEIRNGRNR